MTMEYYLGRKRRKIYRPIAFILFLLAVFTVLFIVVMRPLAVDAAVYRGKIIMTQHLQETVIETLKDPVSYEELVVIIKDTEGRVSSVRIDSAKISRLQAVMAKRLNERLSSWNMEETSISLGTLTGVWIFNGRGPLISFYTAPVSAVKSQINHRFESAGINQTRHSVELELSVDAKTLILGEQSPFSVSTSVILSDTIIVGVTPDVFAGIAAGKN